MKIKPATPATIGDVRQAIECLRAARDLLKKSNCPQTLRRVRLAITSAGGALRHVERRATR